MFTAKQDREINKCHLRELKLHFCVCLLVIFPVVIIAGGKGFITHGKTLRFKWKGHNSNVGPCTLAYYE